MIPDQTATAGASFIYRFPEDTFTDADGGDTLTYSATRDDGTTLPSWLGFTDSTRTLSGMPADGDVGTVTVRVTADDGNGGSVHDDFDIEVNAMPQVSFESSTYSAEEGDAATVTVSISLTRGTDTTVPVSYTNGTADDEDYSKSPTTVTIPANASSAPFQIQTTEDASEESDETFTIAIGTLPDGVGKGSTPSATVTITDDDRPPTPVASFVAVTSSEDEDQGTRVVKVGVNLNPAPQSAITLGYSVGGTATPGDDFTIHSSGTLQVAFGQASVNIPVTIIDDNEQDDGETVILSLIEGSGYTVGSPGEHVLTITNDNDNGGGAGISGGEASPQSTVRPVVVSISGGEAVSEGGTATFTVNAEPAPATALAVRLDLAETGQFLAAPGEGERTVTVAAGATAATLRVATVDDKRAEADGFLTATVAAGEGYVTGKPSSARVDVLDDDLPKAGFALASQRADELSGTVDVRVTLDPVPAEALSLSYTVGGTATTGADHAIADAGRSGVLPVPAGAATATVRVELRDDRETEGNETVVLALVPGAGYAIGDLREHVLTIVDNDLASAAKEDAARPAFLARFGRSVAQQASDGVAARMAANRTSGLSGTLAGRTLPEGRLAADAGNGIVQIRRFLASPVAEDSGTGGTMNSGEALAGTTFALTRSDGSASLAFWARGARSGFRGAERGTKLDGEVAGLLLGTDRTVGDRLFGVMLSRSQGEGGYESPEGQGRIEAGLTALVPYGAIDAGHGIRAWGAAGIGSGEMTLTPDGDGPVSADVGWRMAAAGLGGPLGAANGALGGTGLSWTADALWTRTTSDAAAGLPSASGETVRLRFGLEGAWVRNLASGATLAPGLGIGLRHDGGDAETGLGLEIGGGAVWSGPARGLTLGLEGRTLVLHEDGGFEEWGLAFALSYDPRPETRRGLSATVNGALGGASSHGVAALLGPDVFPEGSDGEGAAWSAEVAHGTSLGKGMVGSPYGRVSGGTLSARSGPRLGYRIEPDASRAADASMDLWAEPAAGGDAAAVGVGMDWQW